MRTDAGTPREAHKPQKGRSLSPALRRWWPLLAVGALLTFAGVAASMSTTAVTPVPLPSAVNSQGGLPGGPVPSPVLESGSAAAAPAEPLPAWLGTVAMVLCVLVVLAVVVPLLWILLRNVISVRRGALLVEQSPADRAAARRDEVLAALDAGLADLSDTDGDPRRAVIACWVRLEQAAALAGSPRLPGDTSTDHVVRLLRRHRVDRALLDRFAEIYREARYATHPVPERMRGQAQAALGQLRGELAGAGSEAGVAGG